MAASAPSVAEELAARIEAEWYGHHVADWRWERPGDVPVLGDRERASSS